jgi:hypothetical protein
MTESAATTSTRSPVCGCLLVVVLIALFPATSWAQQPPEMVLYATEGYLEGLRTKAMMEKMDVNSDGVVSKDEWLAYEGRVFDALDTNKDGYLEPAEFYQTANDHVIPFATPEYSHGLMTKEMFNKIDINRDGRISKREFLDYQGKLFDMMDHSKKRELGVGDFITGGAER